MLTSHGHVFATLVSHTTCLLRPFSAAPRGGRKSSFYCSVLFCDVTRVMLNHATGFGLEIWSVYQFYVHQAHIERLKSILL